MLAWNLKIALKLFLTLICSKFTWPLLKTTDLTSNNLKANQMTRREKEKSNPLNNLRSCPPQSAAAFFLHFLLFKLWPNLRTFLVFYRPFFNYVSVGIISSLQFITQLASLLSLLWPFALPAKSFVHQHTKFIRYIFIFYPSKASKVSHYFANRQEEK